MKNILKTILAIFIIIFIVSSCEVDDFLEKAPGVDVTEDTIFSSQVQVETFVAGLYRQGLHSMLALNDGEGSDYFQMSSGATDEGQLQATWGEPRNWNVGGVSTTNVNYTDKRYHLRWSAIRRANILLERIDEVPNVGQPYINQIKGEALAIRAMNYFEMLKRYGGVPIVDKRISPEDLLETPLKRNTVKEVVDFIVKDCDEASSLLPDSYSSNMRGRITKGTALMIKAKAILTVASPQFNTNTPFMDLGDNNNLIVYGNYEPSLWQKAADAAKAVIDWAPSGGIHLITEHGPEKNYKYMWETLDNPEVILAHKRYFNRSSTSYPWPGILPNMIYWGYGGPSPTLNFVSLYEKRDGTPQVWNPEGGDDLNQKYEELDYRFAASIMYNGSYLNRDYPIIQTFQGGVHAANCHGGHWQRKFVPEALTSSTPATPNNILYRLAEAYLIFAEALNEAQGPVDEAYNAVNIIRNRSGQPNLPSGLTQDEFRTRVRNERAIELAFEDNRLYDILRWMIAEEDGIMTGDMWGLKIHKIPESTEFNYEPYIFSTRTFPKRMYLHPFHKGEIDKGYLVQNPGW